MGGWRCKVWLVPVDLAGWRIVTSCAGKNPFAGKPAWRENSISAPRLKPGKEPLRRSRRIRRRPERLAARSAGSFHALTAISFLPWTKPAGVISWVIITPSRRGHPWSDGSTPRTGLFGKPLMACALERTWYSPKTTRRPARKGQSVFIQPLRTPRRSAIAGPFSVEIAGTNTLTAFRFWDAMATICVSSFPWQAPVENNVAAASWHFHRRSWEERRMVASEA